MKTALIVDDSPVARTVLRKTLVESGISVDEVPSAEAAIEYLRSEEPDVIFLDHLMPGMDGFEALQAIKANPDTALIPVIMYTSQDGQVYVSQARALGAVDVIPKTFKPANIMRLLRSHHLTDDSEPRPSIQQAVRDVQHAARGIVRSARTVHEEEVLKLVKTMLQEHRDALLNEVRTHLSRIDRKPVRMAPPPVSRARPQPTEAATFGKHIAVATIATTFAAAFWFGALNIYTARLQSEAPYQLLRPSLAPGIAANQQNVAPSAALPRVGTGTDETDLLLRSKARVQHYAFGAIPLDDDRAREYEVLLADLKNEGFAGIVQLDVFEGRYCLNATSEGGYGLAPLEQPAISCDRIGTPTETVLSTQQSVSFSNMMAVATRDGLLRIETVFHGPALPIVDYPVLDYGVTAGEWNAAAAYNQRVTLRLAQYKFDLRGGRIADTAELTNLDRIMAEVAR